MSHPPALLYRRKLLLWVARDIVLVPLRWSQLWMDGLCFPAVHPDACPNLMTLKYQERLRENSLNLAQKWTRTYEWIDYILDVKWLCDVLVAKGMQNEW